MKTTTNHELRMTHSQRPRSSLVIRHPSFERGVTLIELMITVALSTVVVGGMSMLMISYSRASNLAQARVNAQQNVRVYLNMMVNIIREADAGSVVIDQVSGAPPYSRMSFTDIEGNSIVFYQQDQKLYFTKNTTSKMLAKNLRTLKFTYPSTDDESLIGVSLCFEEPIYGTQTNVLHLSVEKVRMMN